MSFPLVARRTVLRRVAAAGAAAAVLVSGAAVNFSYAASLNQDLKTSAASSAASSASLRKQGVLGTAKGKKAIPTAPGRTLTAGPQPSAANTANTVNRLLAPRASDPKVPLPQENLAQEPASYKPLEGPRLYGREEQGGAVLGFRIPIPADHGAFDSTARSRGAGAGQESTP